jgi:hypothetical protein
MTWEKNQYGGYRDTAGRWYLQQIPEGYYQVFRRHPDGTWALAAGPFPNAEAAKRYVETGVLP